MTFFSPITKSIKVANYMVQFKGSKFRISLPSRREYNENDEDKVIMSQDISSKPIFPLVEYYNDFTKTEPGSNALFKAKKSSWDLIENNYEYIFFNEDLLIKLNDFLSVMRRPQENYRCDQLKLNLKNMVNFCCMVSYIIIIN